MEYIFITSNNLNTMRPRQKHWTPDHFNTVLPCTDSITTPRHPRIQDLSRLAPKSAQKGIRPDVHGNKELPGPPNHTHQIKDTSD